MEDIDYKKINDYFNELSLHLFESKDLENYYNVFMVLNDCLYDYFGKRYFINNSYHIETKTNNMTFLDVVNIAREVIETFSTEYAQIFDNLLNNGVLDFSYDQKYYDSHVKHVFNNGERIKVEININRMFNYSDVEVLVHEFMHYVCFMGNGIKNKILGEFISIYFELYAIEYVYKHYKFNIDELFYNRRLVHVFNQMEKTNKIEVPLALYKNIGNLDDNSYIYAKSFINNYNKEKYDYECSETLKIINGINNGDLEKDVIESSHYYTIATIFAYYFRKKNKIDDILNFVRNIGNKDNFDLDIIELLSKYNLNIKDDIMTVLKESLDEYLEQFEKDKKQRI